MAELTVTLTMRLRWWVKPIVRAVGYGLAAAVCLGLPPAAAERWIDRVGALVALRGVILRAA